MSRSLPKPVNKGLEDVAQERRERLEAISEEMLDVRRCMDRHWYAVETPDLEINDILSRIREHQGCQELVEAAAEKARDANSNYSS